MTPEQLRMMNKNELLELLQSALNIAKHMSMVEDPRVHGSGENGPLMAIGDLEIWPRGEPGARLSRLADLTRVLEAQKQEAVKEAGRRDQKWMDGINEIVGRKLNFGLKGEDHASSALEQLVTDRNKAESRCKLLEAQNQKMKQSLEAILEVADLIDDETGHQSRHIREALNYSHRTGSVEKHQCSQCCITSPPQVEVIGPFAWQTDAAKKYFCSMRCFHKWLVHYQNDLDEARAAQLPSQAATD